MKFIIIDKNTLYSEFKEGWYRGKYWTVEPEIASEVRTKKVKKDEKAEDIGTMEGRFPGKPYGKYVELGARGRPGVHMLQRAASEHGSEYKQIMEDAMKHA